MRTRLLAALCTLALAGCDLLGPDHEPASPVTGVFVANQGNFSDGNGSISTFDPATGQASADALADLGTLVQSVLVHDGTLYVAANTGGRVEAFDARTLAHRATYGGMLSPRYMAVAGQQLFVTNLYGDPATFTGGTVSVIDLKTGQKVRDVPVGENPEGIVAVGERVYVANSGFGYDHTVTVLDAATGDAVETLDAACDGPRSLAADAEGDVWLLCTGRTDYDSDGREVGYTGGALVVFDGVTGAIVKRFDGPERLGAAALGQDLFFSPEADELYVVVEGQQVWRFDTRTNTRTATLTFPSGSLPVGAVAYDAAREELYLGRVAGYTAGGEVTRHNREGTLLGRFPAGIVPTFITFRQGR